MRSRVGSALAFAVFASACAQRSAPVEVPVPQPQNALRLSVSRFVAFGDGITEGLLYACPGAPAPASPTVSGPPARGGIRSSVQSPISYPARLRSMLAERFPDQPIEVINEGVGGEEIEAGATDLERVLVGDGPEVLLLLEGVNSINARHAAAIPEVVAQLRAMIQVARRRGVVVFVGTLLPEREGACRAYDFGDGVNDIIAANVQIRTMVGDEGAMLVDLYRAFSGRTAVLLGPDGLHPNTAGYQAIADAFLASIERHLGD